MVRQSMRMRRGFYLRLKNQKMFFREAGSMDCGDGETAPYLQMTMYIDQAHCFKTAKSANAMCRLLKEKYGKSTSVFKYEGRA